MSFLLLLIGFILGGCCTYIVYKPRITKPQVPKLEDSPDITMTVMTPCCEGNIEAICSLIHEFHVVEVAEHDLFERILTSYLLYWSKSGYIQIDDYSLIIRTELPPMVPSAELELFWILRGKMYDEIRWEDVFENIRRGKVVLQKWIIQARMRGRHALQHRGLITPLNQEKADDTCYELSLSVRGWQATSMFHDHLTFLQKAFSAACPGNPSDWNSYITESILLGFPEDLACSIDVIDPQYFILEWGMSYDEWLSTLTTSHKLSKTIADIVFDAN